MGLNEIASIWWLSNQKRASLMLSQKERPGFASTCTMKEEMSAAPFYSREALQFSRGRSVSLIRINHEAKSTAQGESVQARAEDDVLADAVAGLFPNQVLDEAGTGDISTATSHRRRRTPWRRLPVRPTASALKHCNCASAASAIPLWSSCSRRSRQPRGGGGLFRS
jgi:hypothetical protein